MAELKVYSIYDEKMECYNTPYFNLNHRVASRNFGDLANDDKSSVYRHPEDYSLYCIGAFDDSTGMINPYDPPMLISRASSFKKDGPEL